MAMIMVAIVSVKEAHGAENALKRFVDGEIDRTQVMFTVEEQTFRSPITPRRPVWSVLWDFCSVE